MAATPAATRQRQPRQRRSRQRQPRQRQPGSGNPGNGNPGNGNSGQRSDPHAGPERRRQDRGADAAIVVVRAEPDGRQLERQARRRLPSRIGRAVPGGAVRIPRHRAGGRCRLQQRRQLGALGQRHGAADGARRTDRQPGAGQQQRRPLPRRRADRVDAHQRLRVLRHGRRHLADLRQRRGRAGHLHRPGAGAVRLRARDPGRLQGRHGRSAQASATTCSATAPGPTAPAGWSRSATARSG